MSYLTEKLRGQGSYRSEPNPLELEAAERIEELELTVQALNHMLEEYERKIEELT